MKSLNNDDARKLTILAMRYEKRYVHVNLLAHGNKFQTPYFFRIYDLVTSV
jgi:hypothetical protein